MGYSPEEMTTDPKCWPDHLHPEDAPRVFEEMRPLIERGGGTVEYRFRHRDGHYIWIQDTFKVVNDDAGRPSELVGAWADITERKSIETELSGTRQRLQYLLAVSPAIIYTTKASGDYRLHLRQRESARDHGLFAGGDDHRSEKLARSSPSRRCRPRVRGNARR